MRGANLMPPRIPARRRNLSAAVSDGKDDVGAAALPASLSIQARPPCSSARPRTSARPRPVPPRLAVVAVVDLAERLEHAVELVARNARAVVFDHDLEVAASARRAGNGDAPALGRELHRVGDQIDQDLLQRTLVGDRASAQRDRYR